MWTRIMEEEERAEKEVWTTDEDGQIKEIDGQGCLDELTVLYFLSLFSHICIQKFYMKGKTF